MQVFRIVLLLVLTALGAALLIKVFSAPLKLAMKLALNTFFGYIALLLCRVFGRFLGLTLGVNLLNALVVGLLGIPGFFLLLLIKWLFRT